VKVLLLAFLLVAGCAHVEPKPAEKPLGPGELVSAQAAQDALAIGSSTKADVRAALGQAVVVDFSSGYEVWVYRERPKEESTVSKTELVLLFSPSGILSKSRVR
jgi:outer membrane protein assembly factor BamE (lipoprotein component of BamABCDE complex)